MARFISLHDARAFAVALILLASGPALAQKETPKAPATPEPPKAQLDEEAIREIEKQIEESTKKLEEARAAAEAAMDSAEAGLDRASDERVEIGGSVVVEEDEVITGDVVAVGGNVDVYGKVMGDAVAVGGRVHVHEGAAIRGDAVAVGSRVHVDEGASVGGERVSVAIGLPGFRIANKDFHEFEKPRFFGFFAKLVWIASTLLLSILFFAVAGRRIDVVSRRVEMQPGHSFLIGLLGAFATPFAIAITAVLLVVTIIGIFLLPVLVLLVVVMFAGGFLGVALAVGRRLVALREGSGALVPARSPYILLVVGYLALHALVIVGMLFGLIPGISIVSGILKGFGVFTLVSAFFLGYGALLLSNFGTRAAPVGGPMLPPIPPAAPPPSSPPPPPPVPSPPTEAPLT
jgi:hypothetical protein